MTSGRETFGPALKAERDRRGITLQAIADSTKISISLLAALERNDMSRWPTGIFRRAFVREYVTAIGLPPEPVVAEFVRLFPDSPCPGAADPTEFRLTLESAPSVTPDALRARVLIAAAEISGVLALGSVAAWWLDGQLWTTCGAVALVYYPLASICLERTPKLRLLYGPTLPPRWRHAAHRALERLHLMWPRPAATPRHPPKETGDTTAASAQEWRTASN